jgi:hypothetical protein
LYDKLGHRTDKQYCQDDGTDKGYQTGCHPDGTSFCSDNKKEQQNHYGQDIYRETEQHIGVK